MKKTPAELCEERVIIALKIYETSLLWSFDFVIFFQDTHSIFRFLSFPSHKNLVTADWIHLQKDVESLKHVIA